MRPSSLIVINAAIASSVLLSGLAEATDCTAPKWFIDPQPSQIRAGGCIALKLTGCRKLPKKLTLTAEGRKPFDLLRSSPHIREDDTYTFLIWYNHDEFERGPDHEIFKVKPYFDQPGTMVLHLAVDDVEVGTNSVTVKLAENAMLRSLELLYPIVNRQSDERFRTTAWLQALMSDATTPSRMDPRAYSEMLKTADIVAAHPDWKDVIEQCVINQQVRRSLLKRKQSQQEKAEEVYPPIAELQEKAGQSNPKMSFAQCLKRSTMNVLRRTGHVSATASAPSEPEPSIKVVVPPGK